MRRFLSVMICLSLCLMLCHSVSAAGAEVTTLSADVHVSEDGSCSVTLTANVHFVASPKTFTVPLAADADDISASGASYDIDEIDDVQCVVFESKHGFTGDVTFVCSYTLPCAITESESAQTFHFALPEKGWDVPIESFEMTVSFPTELTAQPSWYSAYHGVDIENYLDISLQGQILSVKSFERFKDQETVSMKLKFAPDSFSLKHLPGQTVSFVTVLFYLLVIAAVGYWFFRLRSKHIRPSARQTVIDESTAGEVPCQMFGASPDIVGILAHWGNLGYLTVVRNRNGRIVLRKQMEMGSERAAAERKLFYSLFRSSDSIDAVNPRVLSMAKRVGVLMKRSWAHRMFRRKSGSPFLLRILALAAGAAASMMMFDLMLPANLLRWFLLPVLTAGGCGLFYLLQLACLHFYGRRAWFFLLGGLFSTVLTVIFAISSDCLLVALLCIALQIFCGIVTMFGGLREKSAVELVRQLLGLRAFLRSADEGSLARLTQADSQYFYRMLPFAEQLGVASAFAKRCRRVHLDPCPWLIDSLSRPHNSVEFYRAYCQIAAAIRNEPTLSQIVKKPITEVLHG